MPCLNEAETLAICIRKALGFLERAGVSGEVVVADNGSTDGSREIAVAEGARVVPVTERGYGAALRGGIADARGTYVIMGDADDSYDFVNLEGFVEELRKGADLVMGNRYKGGIKPNAMPFLHKYLGNPVLSFIGRLFFSIPTGDFNCGLRGFNRRSIQELNLSCPGMEFASEMVVKSALHGRTLKEVPTTLSPDGRSRAPHLKTWRDGWRNLRFMLLHSPKWLFAVPGIVLLLVGLVGAVSLASGPVTLFGDIKLDLMSMIASFFSILLGIQLGAFSFVSRSLASDMEILPRTRKLERLFGVLGLERMLQISLLLFLGGLGGAIWALATWAGIGFGDIHDVRMAKWFALSLTSLTAGVQIAAVSFMGAFVRLRTAVDPLRR